jgi:hypothetical protein
VSRPSGARNRPIRVAYLKVHDSGYPRNARIRAYLESTGRYEVQDIGSSSFGLSIRDALDIVWKSKNYDVLILAEFQLKHALVAKLASIIGRSVLVVDSFVGRHETVIGDWGLANESSAKAMVCRVIDSIAFKVSDLSLIDTQMRANTLETRHGRNPLSPRTLSLPVGAPAWATGLGSVKGFGTSLRLLYYGDYTPLQGVEYVLHAIKHLTGSVPIEFTLVGDGPRKAAVLAAMPGESEEFRANLVGRLSVLELRERLNETDVVLGVFGSSDKAGSVIANKVWQGLAAGRIVLTRESEALDEIRSKAGEALWQVDPASPDAIADALNRIWVSEPQVSDSPDEALEAYVSGEFLKFESRLSDELTKKKELK